MGDEKEGLWYLEEISGRGRSPWRVGRGKLGLRESKMRGKRGRRRDELGLMLREEGEEEEKRSLSIEGVGRGVGGRRRRRRRRRNEAALGGWWSWNSEDREKERVQVRQLELKIEIRNFFNFLNIDLLYGPMR